MRQRTSHHSVSSNDISLHIIQSNGETETGDNVPHPGEQILALSNIRAPSKLKFSVHKENEKLVQLLYKAMRVQWTLMGISYEEESITRKRVRMVTKYSVFGLFNLSILLYFIGVWKNDFNVLSDATSYSLILLVWQIYVTLGAFFVQFESKKFIPIKEHLLADSVVPETTVKRLNRKWNILCGVVCVALVLNVSYETAYMLKLWVFTLDDYPEASIPAFAVDIPALFWITKIFYATAAAVAQTIWYFDWLAFYIFYSIVEEEFDEFNFRLENDEQYRDIGEDRVRFENLCTISNLTEEFLRRRTAVNYIGDLPIIMFCIYKLMYRHENQYIVILFISWVVLLFGQVIIYCVKGTSVINKGKQTLDILLKWKLTGNNKTRNEFIIFLLQIQENSPKITIGDTMKIHLGTLIRILAYFVSLLFIIIDWERGRIAEVEAYYKSNNISYVHP